MSELVFCDCGETFDSSQGHTCLDGRWTQETLSTHNITIQAVENELKSLILNLPPSTIVQGIQSTSITIESENTKQDYFVNTILNNLATHSNDQLTHSTRACAAGGMSSDFMSIISEQAYSREYVSSASNSQALFHNNELLAREYNSPMRQSFPNIHMSLSNSQLPTMGRQFRMNEDNLMTPSSPDWHNKGPDFNMINALQQQTPPNEFQTVNALQDFQTQTNIQNGQVELMDNQIERLLKCEICGVSNNVEVNSDHWSRTENEMRNLPQNIMTESNIQLPEMNRQFVINEQIPQEMRMDGHFGNTTQDFSIRESEPDFCSMLSDIRSVNSTHDTASYTGLPDNQVRLNRTNVEKFLYECTSASAKYQFELKDMTLIRCEEEFPVKGVSKSGKSESFVDHSIHIVHAVAGPSQVPVKECSFDVSVEGKQTNAFICKVCEKKFAGKGNLKSHMLILSEVKAYECKTCGKPFKWKSNLQKHKLIHLGKKPLSCNICRTPFRLKQHLKNHMRVHDGEKPYLCEICGKSYTRNSYLRNHFLTHK